MPAFYADQSLTVHPLCLVHPRQPDAVIPTVFVIDHDAAVRDALSISLDANGFHPLTFSSATGFLKALPFDRQGCLLVEYDLEDMKATDLVARLIGRRINLPVVIMSARLRRPVVIDPLPRGIGDFLHKPFGQNEMLTRLHLAMGQKK